MRYNDDITMQASLSDRKDQGGGSGLMTAARSLSLFLSLSLSPLSALT